MFCQLLRQTRWLGVGLSLLALGCANPTVEAPRDSNKNSNWPQLSPAKRNYSVTNIQDLLDPSLLDNEQNNGVSGTSEGSAPDPTRLTRQAVYLSGTVTERVPLLQGQVYQLEDETGAVWVLTPDSAPAPGDKLLIQGRVYYESIPLGGAEFGEVYVEEQQQLERMTAESS